MSYYLDTHSGLPIKSFFTDPNDTELQKLTPFLEKLATVKDVREVIRDVVSKNQINYKKIDEFLGVDTRTSRDETGYEKKMALKQSSNVKSSSIKKTGAKSSIDLRKPEVKKLEMNSNRSSNSNVLNTRYQSSNLYTRNEKTSKLSNTINLRTVKKGFSTVNTIKKEESKKFSTVNAVKLSTNSPYYTNNKSFKPKVDGVFRKSASIVNLKSRTSQNLKDTLKPLVRTSSNLKIDPNTSYTSSVKNSFLTNTTRQISPIKSRNTGKNYLSYLNQNSSLET